MNFLPLETLVPASLRASIRAHVAAIPQVTAGDQADEIADLVVLAVHEAVAAIDRIAGRASSFGASMAVLSAATSTTKAVLENLEGALVSYAEASGAKVYSGRVSIGGEAR